MIQNAEIKNKNDPDTARKNLEKFPTLVEMLQKTRLEKLLRSNSCHPLIQLLSNLSIPEKDPRSMKITEMKYEIRRQYHSYAMISDIEESLKLLFKKSNDMPRELRNGLLNEEKFYEALSELNVASRLKRKYDVELQSKIHNRPYA